MLEKAGRKLETEETHLKNSEAREDWARNVIEEMQQLASAFTQRLQLWKATTCKARVVLVEEQQGWSLFHLVDVTLYLLYFYKNVLKIKLITLILDIEAERDEAAKAKQEAEKKLVAVKQALEILRNLQSGQAPTEQGISTT